MYDVRCTMYDSHIKENISFIGVAYIVHLISYIITAQDHSHCPPRGDSAVYGGSIAIVL
jgi:hypothetical protein